MADRASVRGCGGGRHDYPWPGSDHDCIYRLSVADLPGACIAALATFIPCYLLTILPAPYFKKYGKHPALMAFVDGITAAAIGAIAGSVVVLAQRAIVDIPTAVLALAAGVLLWKYKTLKEPVVVVGAALIGMAVYPMLQH
jgi:chromate transporter